MGRILGAGSLELYFAPENHFSNDQAPTLAELNDAAVIDLTEFLAPAGIDTPLTGNRADAADWSTGFDKTSRGTYGGDPISAEFWYDETTNTAWDTLPRGTLGYFVLAVLPLATAGTFAEDDVIEIWPIDVDTRARIRTPRNENQRFMVEAGVPDEPVEDYSVPAA